MSTKKENINTMEVSWSRITSYNFRQFSGKKNMDNSDFLKFLRKSLLMSEEEMNLKIKEIGWIPCASKFFNPTEGTNPRLVNLLKPIEGKIKEIEINKADIQDSIANICSIAWKKVFRDAKEKKKGAITLGLLTTIKFWFILPEEFDEILEGWRRNADDGVEQRLSTFNKISYLEKLENFLVDGVANFDNERVEKIKAGF